MNRRSLLGLSLTASLAMLVHASADTKKEGEFPTPEGAATTAARVLRETLQNSTSADELRKAARKAAESLEPHSPVHDRLVSALEKNLSDDDLATALRETHERLTFRPKKEADLPTGFPTYTPPGTIEVKQYPAYRRAVGNAFFPLFRHITRNDIAMTAPVEMRYDEPGEGRLSQTSMSFLYGKPDMGRPGKDGQVEVVDTDPLTVVSLGVVGKSDAKTIREARKHLDRWLAASQKYESAGPLRVMGYNSPFVPRSKSFLEVQVPVRERKVRKD